MYGRRIMIADGDSSNRKFTKDLLSQAGYIVVAEAPDSQTAMAQVFNIQPDIILLHTKLPGQGSPEVSRVIEHHRIAPVILIADYEDYGFLAEAVEHWVFGYLIKPFDPATLVATLEIAIANFRRLVNLEQENKKLKKNLETRKLVERAKGVLAKSKGLSEEEAFRMIQKISMDQCVSIKKVAVKVISKYGAKQ